MPETFNLSSLPPDRLPLGISGVEKRLTLGPRVHPSAWLAPNATVIGDVTLTEKSSVWYSAVLRGDINRIVVGPRSNVQDAAVLHLADDLRVWSANSSPLATAPSSTPARSITKS